MAKSDEVLDRVFREKLEHHQESPRLAVWDKLEAQLDVGKQPKKSYWWAIAAAMPLLLGIGYLIWSQAPQADQESSLAASEEVLEIPAILESTPETEAVVSEEDQKSVYQAEKVSPLSSKPILAGVVSQKNAKEAPIESRLAEAFTSPIPQKTLEATVNSATETEIWVTPEPTRTSTPTSSQASLAAAEEVDGYRIRIFSDGLKKEEASPKNLITELGKTVGQVEGLLEKLDEGFGEIQDRKERLFSSLVGRKSTPIEKQKN